MFNSIVTTNRHFIFFAGVRQKDDTYTIRLLCYQDGKLLTATTLNPGNLAKDIKRLVNRIPGFAALQCCDGTPVQLALYEKLEKGEFAVYDDVSDLGWQSPDNRNCRYACAQLLAPDGRVVFHGLAPQLGKMKIPARPEEWCSKLTSWSRDHVKRQVVLALSLAAPLVGLWQRNLIVALIGNSSSGKTTAAKLATSLFMPPNCASVGMTFNATENALMQRLHGNKGVPVLIDDTSLSGWESFENIIYTLADGTPRLRFRGDQGKELQHWHTTIFLTSERSLLDHRSKKLEGVLGRLIEIPVSENDLFDSSSQAQEIQRFYKCCHGIAGCTFVRLLLNMPDKDMEACYDKWRRKLEAQNPERTPLVCRQIEQIALVGMAAEFAAKIGLTLDAEQITGYLLDCVMDAIACDSGTPGSVESAEELVDAGIQSILAQGGDEIYMGKKGAFLPVASEVWKEFVRNSGLGTHEVSRIREQLGYTSATLPINGKTQRGFYLKKEGMK